MMATAQRKEEMLTRRQEQRTRTAGFTQSPTAVQIDGVPVHRKFARQALKVNRRKLPPTTPDKHADAKADGILKIRDFHLRAGLLLIPYTENEMRQMLIEAKEEFEADGVLSVDTEMKLTNASYDVPKLTQMWSLMDAAGVNLEGIDPEDAPLNTFGEGEEPEHG